MRTLRQMNISIRSQALLNCVLAALWGYSFFGWMSEMDSRHAVWTCTFFFTPLVMLMFGTILFVSCRRTGHRFSWLARLALLAAVSPWLILMFIILHHVLLA
jgi:hypothetical protein